MTLQHFIPEIPGRFHSHKPRVHFWPVIITFVLTSLAWEITPSVSSRSVVIDSSSIGMHVPALHLGHIASFKIITLIENHIKMDFSYVL